MTTSAPVVDSLAAVLVPCATALLLGAAGWTLLEYVLHRFVFHGDRGDALGAREHRQHHAEIDYFAPWWMKGLAAVAAAAIVLPLAAGVAGRAPAVAFTTGFIATYLGYEVLHRRAHTHAPRGRYGRWLRRNHFAHHFVDPARAHGVTTPFWDHVFGTTLRVERVPVPRSMAMPWLAAAIDANGRLAPPYDRDFVIRGAPRDEARGRA